MKPKTVHLLILLVMLLMTGCVQHHGLSSVSESGHAFFGEMNQKGLTFEQRSTKGSATTPIDSCNDHHSFGGVANINTFQSKALSQSVLVQSNKNLFSGELTLSPGDLVELQLENGEGFAGNYIIDSFGNIAIPMIAPIVAAGRTPSEVSKDIELALIRAELFQAQTALSSLKVLRWSAIEVTVEGAVFQAGRVLINSESKDAIYDAKDAATGDFQPTRLLSEALRAASGIRPDAALDKIILVRNGWAVELDLTGILTGQPVTDIPLVAGDHVVVKSTGCFQANLVRPSQITPKGFRVFMSNLIDSANSNSNAAIGRFSSSMPYGSKLLQAAVSANCVGGKEWTNASRKIILASEHPITKETQVIERSVEQLVRNSNRDEINPYLMPNDTIACYDSDITNLRDVAATIADIIIPIKLL